jgi:hypothetical protein
MYEYNERPQKDLAVDGLNQAKRDWTFHFSNDYNSNLGIRTLQSMTLPFEETIVSKPNRMFRSKTVRKYVKKLNKKRIKKKAV